MMVYFKMQLCLDAFKSTWILLLGSLRGDVHLVISLLLCLHFVAREARWSCSAVPLLSVWCLVVIWASLGMLVSYFYHSWYKLNTQIVHLTVYLTAKFILQARRGREWKWRKKKEYKEQGILCWSGVREGAGGRGTRKVCGCSCVPADPRQKSETVLCVWWGGLERSEVRDCFVHIYMFVCVHVCGYLWRLEANVRCLPLSLLP